MNVTKIPVYADESLARRDRHDHRRERRWIPFSQRFRSTAISRSTHWADLRTVAAGEPCPICGKPLKIQRAIEVGHVFKLGTKYSEKLGALFPR